MVLGQRHVVRRRLVLDHDPPGRLPGRSRVSATTARRTARGRRPPGLEQGQLGVAGAGQPRGVVRREDGQHAREGRAAAPRRPRGSRPGRWPGHGPHVRDPVDRVLEGVPGPARDLVRAVRPAQVMPRRPGSARPSARSSSIRTTTLRASGTLNALSRQRRGRGQLGLGGAAEGLRRRRAARQHRLGRPGPPRHRAPPRRGRAARRAPRRRRRRGRRPPRPRANAYDARSRTLRYAERAPNASAGSSTAVIRSPRRQRGVRSGSSPGSRYSSSSGSARGPSGPRPGRRRRAPPGRPPCRRDASRCSAATPEDGEVAVLARPRRAARSRRPLVARLRDVLEVHAAGALQQVAADGGHVAQLSGRPGQQRLGQHRVARRVPAGRRRGRCCARRRRCAARRRRVGSIRSERQPGDVDEQAGGGHAELHQVDQVGAAAEEGRAGTSGHGGDRRGRVGRRARSRTASPRLLGTSRIAATMLT